MDCVRPTRSVVWDLCARVWFMGRLCIDCLGRRRSRILLIFLDMRVVMEVVGLWLLLVDSNVQISFLDYKDG